MLFFCVFLFISVIGPNHAADFNGAFAASVHSNVAQLVSLPWTRINAVLYSAFHSK
jgi:hypothetical protein